MKWKHHEGEPSVSYICNALFHNFLPAFKCFHHPLSLKERFQMNGWFFSIHITYFQLICPPHVILGLLLVLLLEKHFLSCNLIASEDVCLDNLKKLGYIQWDNLSQISVNRNTNWLKKEMQRSYVNRVHVLQSQT
jgi:hypothetical protein